MKISLLKSLAWPRKQQQEDDAQIPSPQSLELAIEIAALDRAAVTTPAHPGGEDPSVSTRSEASARTRAAPNEIEAFDDDIDPRDASHPEDLTETTAPFVKSNEDLLEQLQQGFIFGGPAARQLNSLLQSHLISSTLSRVLPPAFGGDRYIAAEVLSNLFQSPVKARESTNEEPLSPGGNFRHEGTGDTLSDPPGDDLEVPGLRRGFPVNYHPEFPPQTASTNWLEERVTEQTRRINELRRYSHAHVKDFHAWRQLQRLIARRRSLLRELNRRNPDRYREFTASIGFRMSK